MGQREKLVVMLSHKGLSGPPGGWRGVAGGGGCSGAGLVYSELPQTEAR